MIRPNRNIDAAYDLNSSMVIKRQPAVLPSVTKNVLRAVGVLILSLIALYAFFSTVKNPDDAIAGGAVELAPLPMPEAPDTLNANSLNLPDLLSGDVAIGDNPTQGQNGAFAGGVDALGNPINAPGTSDRVSESSLAGAQSFTPDSGQPVPASTGPKVILIDGQPLSGTAIAGQNISRPGRLNASPLVRAPIAGLSRSGPFGRIPSPAPDGRKSVNAYARPFTASSGMRPVSIIIGGLGVDSVTTRRAIYELPANVTLSFAAHAPGLQTWVNQARAQGHEVMLELPMEYDGFNASEPGANYALRVNGTPARNIRNLDWLMSRAQGYFAVTNYNGDALLRRSDIMSPILSHIASSGVGFFYDGAVSAPTLRALSDSVALPYAEAFTLLDLSPAPSAIQAELLRIEQQAQIDERTVGVGFALNATIDALIPWISELPGKGLELAPASHVMRPERL